MEKQILTVSALNNYIKQRIETIPELANVCISGEVSNYKLYPSGHHYFSLKDSESSISCVMFKGNAYSLRFRPENGMQVIVTGRVSVYPRDGKYQFLCTNMMPAGSGDLSVAFEQLKKKLDAEGLFATSAKKALPIFPERIALVTSGSGAAVHDMIRILGTRWPMSKVIVVPVRVQGSEASEEISAAIRFINRNKIADLIITGRGGGSAEDLWCFNSEKLARVIFDSVIPVISAVGHEPDVTISDYVADKRASTPSNAAEIAVPQQEEIRSYLRAAAQRLTGAQIKRIESGRDTVARYAEKRVLKDPKEYLLMRRIELDRLYEKLESAQEKTVSARKQILSASAARLDALSPLKVLARGYNIALRKNGTALKTAAEAENGEKLSLRFADGEVKATVYK